MWGMIKGAESYAFCHNPGGAVILGGGGGRCECFDRAAPRATTSRTRADASPSHPHLGRQNS
eukprot:4947304-Pyramimonas_sp.AAC.1